MGLFWKKDLSYDEDKCLESIEILETTKKIIAKTASSINSQFDIINGANGFAKYCNGTIDAKNSINEISSFCEDAVDELVLRARKMVESIEEYNNASWWQQDLASLGMGATKIFEGIGTFGEQLGDGVLTVVGFTTGWINEGWKNSISDLIAKDHAGEFFYEQYEDGLLSGINDLSNFSHTSKAADICKAAGTIAGYVVLDAATAGLGTATNTAWVVGASATAGTGRKTQSELQNGKDFYKAASAGLIQGAIDGGTAYAFKKLEQATNANKANETFTSKNEPLNIEPKTKALGGKTADETKLLTSSADDIASTASKADDFANAATDKIDDVVETVQPDAVIDANGRVIDVTGKTSSKILARAEKMKTKIANSFDKAKKVGNTAKDMVGKTKLGTKVTKVGTKVTKVGKVIGNTAVKHPNIAKTIGTAYAGGQQISATNASEQFIKNSINKEAFPVSKAIEDINKTKFSDIDKNYEAQFNGKKKTTTSSNKINTNSTPTPTPTPTPNKNEGGGSSSKKGTASNNKITNTTSRTATTPSPTSTTPTAYTSEENSKQQFKREKVKFKEEKQDITDKKPTPTESTPTPSPTPNPNPNPNPTPEQTTPPSNNTNNTTTTTPPPTQNTEPPKISTPNTNNDNGGSTQHTGGGYSASSGYKGYSDFDSDYDYSIDDSDDFTSIDDMLSDSTTSIDDVIKGSKYTKIPTSSKPITSSSSGKGGSTVIPVIAGLSAAAAAGVGAKVYMDRKNNNDNGEDDEIATEEWSGEDSLDIEYDDSKETQEYLDDDDDYGYQTEEETEKYDARNNEELADLQ